MWFVANTCSNCSNEFGLEARLPRGVEEGRVFEHAGQVRIQALDPPGGTRCLISLPPRPQPLSFLFRHSGVR